MIEIIKYSYEFQLGITFGKHNHGDRKHYHIWIDIGTKCIEITFR